MLTTFDFHIIRRFSLSYLVLVGVLVGFFVVLHYVEYVDDFIDRGATMGQVFTVYYPNYVPEIVRLISPLALFLACLYLTGRLAQKLEFTALQTSGVSLYRLLLPFVIVALVVTGFLFWFNGWVVPNTNRTRIAFELQYTKDTPKESEYNNIHRQNRPGSMLSVGFFERSTQTAHTVTLQQFDDNHRLLERLDAVRMAWQDSTETWRLHGVTRRAFLPDGREVRGEESSIDTTLTLGPRDIARTDGDVEAMTITEAAAYLDVLRRSGADNLGLPSVVYYGKYSYPFANLILVLIGVPMAAVRRRGGQALVMGIGLLTAFVYLAFMKLLEPFGYSGEVSPLVAAWLPHVAFFAVAIAALFGARK